MEQKAQAFPRVWVLVDNRVGNANQAIELAEKLGEKFEIKQIEYNAFGRLPNSLLSLFPIHVKKSILSNFKKAVIPELIISSGRRTASLAIYLKKLSKGKTKIIQIMRPGLDPKEFSLIILPQHDNFNYTLPNIVRILGALTNVQEKFAKARGEFEAKYPDIKQFIAVIIGGSTKKYTLTLDNAKLLESTLSTLSNNHSLPLFITFSRRTPVNVKKYFIKNFLWPNIIYDPADAGPNPYPIILQKAEYIISTTDSISMCSEAASTGKPVYVFCPANFKLKKHNFFIQQLVDIGIVRRLETTTNYLEKYEYEPLSEISKVVDVIKEKIL
ncbi:MAG: mitochondrial fission ELM1 family protein [Rickettsiaceae bacterium]|nr:mitochondrial fission ELM1 family protein [Rickettsiaceae bacterium]